MSKPVAWMNESNWLAGVELDVITDEFLQSGKGGDCSEYTIPLYTHPVKELTDAELYELLPVNLRADEEDAFIFARAILRKAQER